MRQLTTARIEDSPRVRQTFREEPASSHAGSAAQRQTGRVRPGSERRGE